MEGGEELRYPSVHREKCTRRMLATTTTAPIANEIANEIVTEMEKATPCPMTWQPALGPAPVIAAAQQKTQHTHANEKASAILLGLGVTTESRTSGRIVMLVVNGIRRLIGTIKVATTGHAMTAAKETAAGECTGMFREECKMASLEEGIPLRVVLTKRACRVGGRIVRLLREF